MNDAEFERSFSEWIQAKPAHASDWVLESVAEHARTHANQPGWHRLQNSLEGRRTGAVRTLLRAASARPLVGATAVAVAAAVLLVAAPLILSTRTPDGVVAPGVLQASPSSESSAGPAVASPAPVQVGFPEDGLTGSVWLERADGAPDHYITLHPDGTLVERIGLLTTVGIGLWQPTSEHTLSSITVYTDADPVRHRVAGMSTHRADWVLDATSGTGALTWRASLQPADGTTPTEMTGEATLTRLHLAGLPDEARYDLPAEHPWRPSLGVMAQGPGSGQVTAVGDVAALSYCVVGPDGPPGYVVLHGDGTTLIATPGGTGAGLWTPSGPDTRALTAWSTLSAASERGGWIAELRGRLVLTGTTNAFEHRFVAAPRRIKAMDGRELPELDAALWPTTGSVWLQSAGGTTAVVAYLTDGTVVARHPTYGTGVGHWQPVGAQRLAASVFFGTTTVEDRRLLWEATTSEEQQHMSIDYQLVDANSGAIETGAADATRLSLAP